MTTTVIRDEIRNNPRYKGYTDAELIDIQDVEDLLNSASAPFVPQVPAPVE